MSSFVLLLIAGIALLGALALVALVVILLRSGSRQA
jgi:hypothetical protein